MRSVLVVEDSDDVRQSFAMWLEKTGYHVLEARSAEEARHVALRARPDVVLMDINLPEADGYSTAAEWKRDPKLAAVPIIVISGRGGADHEKRARESGALLALRKPCLPDMMLAAVAGALGGA